MIKTNLCFGTIEAEHGANSQARSSALGDPLSWRMWI